MINNKLTDDRINQLIRVLSSFNEQNPSLSSHGIFPVSDALSILNELQERRKADDAGPVSFDSLNAAVAEVTGCNQHTWNAAIYKGHHPVPSMNYNSLARIVDMYRSPQPTPAISCPKPVVKLPTTRCWAGISNFYYAADVIAAIRAAGVEVSND
ncbi:hypothetical protein CWG78_02090 [Salmonella enterica subsp. enterica serovar Halle]|nr:hypothetical protein [Salmonella enterica subsp. enterica serovar Halle]HDC2633606.1 hypothetical protein [Salmonella enterica]